MKLDLVIRELHRAESELLDVLRRMADEHTSDPDTHHVARDLATWSRRHVHVLAQIGKEHQLDLDPDPDGAAAAPTEAVAWLGPDPAPPLVLLADYRHLYRVASGAYLDWTVLAQSAQAARLPELLDLAQQCQSETERQMRWAKSRLTDAAPQAFAG